MDGIVPLEKKYWKGFGKEIEELGLESNGTWKPLGCSIVRFTLLCYYYQRKVDCILSFNFRIPSHATLRLFIGTQEQPRRHIFACGKWVYAVHKHTPTSRTCAPVWSTLRLQACWCCFNDNTNMFVYSLEFQGFSKDKWRWAPKLEEILCESKQMQGYFLRESSQ